MTASTRPRRTPRHNPLWPPWFPPPDATQDDKGKPNIILDIAKAIPGGIQDAVEATGDIIAEALDAAGLPVALGTKPEKKAPEVDEAGLTLKTGPSLDAHFLNKDEVNNPIFGKVGEKDGFIGPSETLAGQMTRGVTQFVTEFAGVSKFLSPIKALRATGTVTNTAARGAGIGAAADFLGFMGDGNNLANLLIEYPLLKTPILEYLTDKTDDTEAGKRLKNALTGLVPGVVLEGLFASVRLIRQARKVSETEGQEAAEKFIQENLEELEQATDAIARDPEQFNLFPELPRTDEQTAAASATRGAMDGEAAKVTFANRIHQETLRPDMPDIDPEAVLQSVKTMGDDVFTSEGITGDFINFSKIDTDDDIKKVMLAAGEEGMKHIDDLSANGRKSLEQMHGEGLEWIADQAGVGINTAQTALSKVAGSVADQTKALVGAKVLSEGLGSEIARLTAKIDGGAATEADKLLLLERVEQIVDVNASLKVIQREAARATASGRRPVSSFFDGEQLKTADVLDRLAAQGGDETIRALSRKLSAAGGRPKAILEIVRRSTLGRLGDITRETFINAILSGPKTHIVNNTSNLINTVFLPIERAIGGQVTGDLTKRDESLMQLWYHLHGVKELISGIGAALKHGDFKGAQDKLGASSLGRFWKAVRTEENVLDPTSSPIDTLRFAISSESQSGLGSAANFLGKAVRMPTRLLMAEDEFFKQINYRAALKAKLHVQARGKFPDVHGADSKALATQRAEWVEEQFQRGFDADGRGLDEEAKAFSREATFTTELEQGSFGRTVQSGAGKFPPLGLIIPFVRTPTNLLRNVWARTPGLQFAQREFREDFFSGDPARKAKAVGQLATGSALYMMAVSLALSGKITGGGPADPKQWAAWLEVNQPYSFETGIDPETGKKKFISFQRLDPFGMFFGLAADSSTLLSSLDEAEAADLMTGSVIALSRNLTSKSYLTGMIDFMEALSQPDRSMENFLQRTVSAFVPTGLK